MGWLYSTVVLFTFICGVCGWAFWRTSWGVGVGAITGLIYACWLSIDKIAPIKYPEAYTYEAQAPQIVEQCTLVINVPDMPSKRINGIAKNEWQVIGECVTSVEPYTFSVQHFKDYFKNTEYDGYSLYSKVVRRMQDAGALVPNSKGGYDVTDHIGKYVFDAMCKEQWEVLEALPER